MADSCPLCGGAGRNVVRTTHRLTGLPKTAIEWCLCSKSRFVSQDVPLLRGLGDLYLTKEEIDPRLLFFKEDLPESPNLLIKTENFDMFALQIKTALMKVRYDPPPALAWAGRSIDVLQRFYVSQPDGSCLTLASTEKFDLMIIALGVSQKNDPLKTVVLDVVQTRLDVHKPTWVYQPTATLTMCTQEFTADLETILTGPKFKEVSLIGNVKKVPIITNTKKAANNYGGPG